MQVIPKKNRQSMPWGSLIKPSDLPPQDPYTQLFYLLILGLLLI